MPEPLPRQPWHQPGEPSATMHTPDWADGLRRIERMRGKKRDRYRALFAHLDFGWGAVRQLQLAAESIMVPGEREDDVGGFVDGQVTDYYRGIALGCLLLVPGGRTGDPPTLEDVVAEAELVARHVRLLAMAAHAPGFPAAFLEVVGAASETLDAWETGLGAVAEPVFAYGG